MTATSVSTQSSAVIFVVLRRMRTPLIVLISIFSISVLGLKLIPGGTAEEPWPMDFFTAFYVMSYTATTIGFGEIPDSFNDSQRMWLTLSIYLTVVGWAYAIGTLLALIQDSSFRQALALQSFRRRVRRLHEPFWLVAGHGMTGEIVGKRLDALSRRFVVLDIDQARVDLLDLGAYSADVPALVADARNVDVLEVGGLGSPYCAGVLALTDDEEANLALTMCAAALRPELPVIVRASSPVIKHRMQVIGSPTVIDPFDRFGDHFRIALRAPATEQLAHWLVDEIGAPLPQRTGGLRTGRWIICGYGRFGQELTRDLRTDGLDVVIIDDNPVHPEPEILRIDSSDPEALRLAGIERAIGLVAGTDNDITNLSVIAAARQANPGVFIVGRQNSPANTPLFDGMQVDLLMQPTAVTAEETMSYVSTPLLHQFLALVAQQDDEWSQALIDRLQQECGQGSPVLDRLAIDAANAPAVVRVLGGRPTRLGDLLRDPEDRDERLHLVVLLHERDGRTTALPDDSLEVQAGDSLLIAGRERASSALQSTLRLDSSAAYVLAGAADHDSWLWRALDRRP